MEYLDEYRIEQVVTYTQGDVGLTVVVLIHRSEPAGSYNNGIRVDLCIVLKELLLRVERVEKRCEYLQNRINSLSSTDGYGGQDA